MKRKIEDVSKLERQQIILEQKYHPKRARELIVNHLMPLRENNDPIWISVYQIVFAFIPSDIESEIAREKWAEDTTYNILARLISLESKNTPIQSIVFAFVDKENKVANALLSMEILIEIAVNTEVCDIKIGETMEGGSSVTIYPKISINVADMIEIRKLYSGLPMLIKPEDWTNNTDGGYLTDVCKSNIILGGVLKQHNKSMYYEGINYLQSIGYRVNETFFNSVEDEKEERYIEVNGKKQKTGYVRNRMITQFYIDAKTPFYFVQKLDNRGRSYSTGYNINNQGYDYQKAVLLFDKEEELTDQGQEWAKVAIAGLYGLDKKTFKERLDWYNDKLNQLVKDAIIAEDVTKCTITVEFIELVEEAEEPKLFEATVINLIEAFI